MVLYDREIKFTKRSFLTFKNVKNGYSYCTDCAGMLKWDGIKCPCCGNKLRKKPRHSKGYKKSKEKLRYTDNNKIVL